MNLTLILIIIILVSFLIIGIVSSICKKLQAENLELKTELEKKKSNLKILLDHLEEIQKIKIDKDKFSEEIRNAKNSEEVLEVINSIITLNNNKLRNKAEKWIDAAAETSKAGNQGTGKRGRPCRNN